MGMGIGYSCLGWDFDVFTVLCTYLCRECASCASLCVYPSYYEGAAG